MSTVTGVKRRRNDDARARITSPRVRLFPTGESQHAVCTPGSLTPGNPHQYRYCSMKC